MAAFAYPVGYLSNIIEHGFLDADQAPDDANSPKLEARPPTPTGKRVGTKKRLGQHPHPRVVLIRWCDRGCANSHAFELFGRRQHPSTGIGTAQALRSCAAFLGAGLPCLGKVGDRVHRPPIGCGHWTGARHRPARLSARSQTYGRVIHRNFDGQLLLLATLRWLGCACCCC